MKKLIYLSSIYVSRCIIRLIIFFAFVLFTFCENKSKVKLEHTKGSILKIKNKSQNKKLDSTFVTIDSIIESPNVIIYKLIYTSKENRKTIYEIENQDHSIEIKKKYMYKKLGYTCYEINDLPTGLIWNIIFEIKNKSFYITEKYDSQAVGDTLDRKSVNFSNQTAKIYSVIDKNKNYTVKLKKNW